MSRTFQSASPRRGRSERTGCAGSLGRPRPASQRRSDQQRGRYTSSALFEMLNVADPLAQTKEERANEQWHPTFLHMLVPKHGKFLDTRSIDEKLASHQAQAVQMDAKITSLGAKMDNILSLLQGQHLPVALPARHRTVSETANETRVNTGKVTNTSAVEPTPEPAANARLRSPPLLVRPRERRRALAPPRQLVR